MRLLLLFLLLTDITFLSGTITVRKTPAPIANKGSSCYLNAIIQLLASAKPFVRKVLAADLAKLKDKQLDAAIALQESFYSLLTAPVGNAVELDAAAQIMKGHKLETCGRHEDASEAFTALTGDLGHPLIDGLEYLDHGGNGQTFLPINISPQLIISLENALEGGRLVAKPQILNILLRRTSHEARLREHKRTKITDPIGIPERLDLSEFFWDFDVEFPQPAVYKLLAYVGHSGTAARGHYIAYVKDVPEHQWYRCDDKNITMVCEKEVLEQAKQSAFFLSYYLESIKDEFAPITSEELERARQTSEPHFVANIDTASTACRTDTEEVNPVVDFDEIPPLISDSDQEKEKKDQPVGKSGANGPNVSSRRANRILKNGRNTRLTKKLAVKFAPGTLGGLESDEPPTIVGEDPTVIRARKRHAAANAKLYLQQPHRRSTSVLGGQGRLARTPNTKTSHSGGASSSSSRVSRASPDESSGGGAEQSESAKESLARPLAPSIPQKASPQLQRSSEGPPKKLKANNSNEVLLGNATNCILVFLLASFL